MKISVEKTPFGNWAATIEQDNQTFYIGGSDTKKEALWFAKMLRVAMKNYKKEILSKK